MSLLANFDLENLDKFWIFYPSYTTIVPYKKLYKEDKSKNKKNSSRIMWAACLLYELCDENPFGKLIEKEKKELIKEDILKNKNFDWKKHEEIFIFFKNTNISQTEKSIIELEEKLKERTDFIMGVEYSLDEYNDEGKLVKGTADQLDKMLAQSDKMFALMEKLKEQRQKEQDGLLGEIKGGREESFIEKQIL